MTDLVFHRRTGRLSGFGREWSAVSGGGTAKVTHAAIPVGTYRVPPFSLVTGSRKVAGVPRNPAQYDRSSYRDGAGDSWFLWLGVGNLGIHPDGGVPGVTLGCIGVTADARALFEELRRRIGQQLTVKVED